MSDETKPQIMPIPKGPLYYFTDLTPHVVEGLKSANGQGYKHLRGTALCRCGQSQDKPFCDGSHIDAGFSSEKIGDGPPDRRKDYTGEGVTVHDNRSLCSHSQECVKRLPSVFDMDGRPWIKADGASVEEVITTVKACPSGALSYSVDGVEHRDQEREPLVVVMQDGPYNLVGGVEVVGEERGEGASQEHCALCRCGESHSKPFCDGSHHDSEFKG